MAAARAERPFDAARFQQSVRDVAAWVELQGVQTWQRGLLRDPRLRPFPHEQDDTRIPDRPRTGVAAAMDALLARRRDLLGGPATAALPTDGRLVACEWNNTMWDTLSMDASDGVFDEGDLPPWDLWVDVVLGDDGRYDCVIAWIPDALVSLADAGIHVNPVDCIGWCRVRPSGRVVLQTPVRFPYPAPHHSRRDPPLVRFLLSPRARAAVQWLFPLLLVAMLAVIALRWRQ